jgi:hypothetical protein
MSWGQELAPLELQNTKGGDWLGFTIGVAVLDFLYHLFLDGGNVGQAAADMAIDMEALVNAFKKLAGIGDSQN